MRQPLTKDDLLTTLEVLEASGGNQTKAADALGISRSSLYERLIKANKMNLTGIAMGGPVPEGFELGKITQHYRTEGKVEEWRRISPQEQRWEAFVKSMEDWASTKLHALPAVPAPAWVDTELLTVYPLPDIHLGQYSWGKETGTSYDLEIATATVFDAFKRLVARTVPSEYAVILGLGDTFHADGYEAATPKSHNALDVDSRYDKVQWMGAELFIRLIDYALQHHQYVIVRILPGNHDPRGGVTLTLALWMRYKDNPRVTIDRTPGLYWFYQWGLTMLSAHHGHEAKAEQMAGIMSSFEPGMWGSTLYRYAYLGHIHKRTKVVVEQGGAIAEHFQAITAKDAWNRGKGHASGRSVQAITISKTEGEIDRPTVPIAAN